MKMILEVIVKPDAEGCPRLMLLINGVIEREYTGQEILATLFALAKQTGTQFVFAHAKDPVLTPGFVERSKGIKKRDVVRCVKALSDELVVGREYTVIDVLKHGDLLAYELKDPEAGRVQALPEEIEFVRENPPFVPAKRGEMEIIEKCGCGEDVVLTKGMDGKYTGACVCNKLLVRELPNEAAA